jgi:Bacterial Ig-like domain (group 3)/FG-GAP-like repeat/Abnormal spindle-like microcephaly-assoc'd, ASPM-SPD-2-Hydin
MRGPFSLLALLSAFIAFPGMSAGQSGTGTATTTVTANPSTITVGGTVGLTATVQPTSTTTRPTGTVTFLDGTTTLSGSPVALTPNGLASATFPQTFGTPDPTFTPQPNIENRGLYTGELVGDLNGDGIPDLLIYSFTTTPFSGQSFTSNGKGGYTTNAVQTFSFLGGCSPAGYIVGSPQLIDLNGDGKTDILCGTLVAYGNGDGTFAQAVTVPFLSSGFETAYAADVNGDGKTDILAVPTISQTQLGSPVQFAFTVFLNQGGGSFASAGTFPVAPITSQPTAGLSPPIVIDLNNDGKPDIISQTLTAGFTQSDNPQRSVDVLLNNGDGTFGAYMPVTLSTPPNNGGGPAPYVMGYGDVNGDGKPDLILTETDTSGNVDAMVLLGNGDGTFQPQTNLILSEGPVPGLPANAPPAISVEDLNLDGKQDLIFSNGQVALGNGDGTFALSTALFSYPQSSTPAWVFPLVQMTLPGNLVPSLVYLLPTATPPAVSVFTPQPSSSATLSPSTLTVGPHSITARYSGDTDYSADTSAAVTVTVNQAVSTTAVTSSVSPSLAGQSVTLTAKVTSNGPTPTGNVTFAAGSTTLATVALSGGSAAYTTSSFTTVGTLAIAASYSGDANTKASSAILSQVITGPTLTLSPSSITFPGQYVGTSGLPLTVTATNPGSAPLTITSVTTNSKDFGVLNACGGSLAAGSSCAIGVFFDPSSSGPVSGTLTIADNAGGQTVLLSGSGQDFSFTSSSSTQTVAPGSTATYTIGVNAIAGFNQTVALSCSGAPTGSTCSLSSSSIALSGSTPASVTVSVTTQGHSAAATQPPNPQGAQIPIFFAICGLPGLLLLGVRRSALCRAKTAAIYGAALLGIVCFVMAGCGGNGSSTGGGGTPANTYTLTVTGTFASGSATLTHSTNLTMVVQ